MATTPITVTVTGQTTPQFTGMFDKAKDYIKNFRSTINTNLLNTMGAAAMASKAIGYVTSTMREVTAEAKKFEQQSSRLGVAPEQIAKLNKLSEESGVPFRAITKGLNQVKKSAAEALIDPNSKMADVFRQLGIDAVSLAEASQDPMKVFGQISDAINEIGDDSEQLKALEGVFKQNGFMLKGMVEMGSEGQRKLVEGNTTMGALSIAQNAEMKDSWEKFWDVIKNGFAMFGVVLNPIVQSLRILLNVIQMMVQALWLVINAVKNLVGSNITIFLATIALSIAALIKSVGLLVKGLGYLTFSGDLKEFGNDMTEFADNLATSSISVAGDALKGQLDDLKDTADKTAGRIKGDLEDMDSSVTSMTKGYGKEETKAEGERRFKAEQDIAEAKKKYTEEQVKGAMIGASDIDKRRQAEKELLEIQKESWKFKTKAQQGTADHYEWLTRQQAKLNEIEAMNRAQRQADEKAREALDKAAVAEEKRTRDEAIAKEQAASEARFNMNKAFEDIAIKMKEDKMRASGATETEIKLATLDRETTKLETMQADINKFLNGRSLDQAMQLDPEGTTKIMTEFAGQISKVQGLGSGIMGGKNTVDFVDDARKRGMGGQVSTVVSSSIPKASLEKLTGIEKNTAILAAKLLGITGTESSVAVIRGDIGRATKYLEDKGQIP